MHRTKREVSYQQFAIQLHDLVDHDLGDAIRSAIVAHKTKVRTSAVASTLSYLLADALVQLADSQNHICELSPAFEHYIHACAHSMFECAEEDEGKGQTKQ